MQMSVLVSSPIDPCFTAAAGTGKKLPASRPCEVDYTRNTHPGSLPGKIRALKGSEGSHRWVTSLKFSSDPNVQRYLLATSPSRRSSYFSRRLFGVSLQRARLGLLLPRLCGVFAENVVLCSLNKGSVRYRGRFSLEPFMTQARLDDFAASLCAESCVI